jgi:putative ABC transport system permease protein
MTTPSRFAERLLSFVVRDPEWRDAVIGDLREEYARAAVRMGAARARRWHRRQSVGIALRYSAHKLVHRTPPPRWLAVAAQEPGGSWMAGLTRDLLYAWRSIRQRPALSAVILTTLALALAANSVTFALMDAIVLRPYRFAGVDRLMIVATNPADAPLLERDSVSRADFREWRAQSRTVAHWGAYQWWDANLSGVDVPETVASFHVTPGFFKLLGVTPALGREFLESEAVPGQDRRVVLGHGLWMRRFASDPSIVGKTVRLDGEPWEVVGVAPAGFQTPMGAEVWGPLAYEAGAWEDRRNDSLSVIGRLADAASLEQSRAELTAIIDTQRRDHPDTNTNRFARVVSFTDGMADPGAGPFMAIWQAAAGLLLLIACANIANLLLARGSERSQEYAVRLALGASRTRLFTQNILEGLVLALLAVAASLPLTWAGLGLSRASLPPSIIRFVPGWEFIHIDLRLFVLTALLATAAMLVFSLTPAVQAVRSQVADHLRQMGRTMTPGRSRQWLRSVLATSQVALALALLFASAIVITAAERAVNGALGFDKNNVLVATLVLPERTYADDDKRRQFATRVMDTIGAVPAVSDVGLTTNIPAGFSNNGRRFWPEGVQLAEADVRNVNYRRVSTGYFAALRIPLTRGRGLNDADRLGSMPVALISTGLARFYWPEQDPIGKRFKVTADGDWVTVVGVTGDVVHNWFTQRQDHTVYRPMGQEAPFAMSFAVRTIAEPTAVAGEMRRAVAAADPDQPIANLSTLDSLVDERASGLTFIARSLGIVALIALVLSVMGIYSLMAFLTTQRTQEIGVRMALGAGRWQVIRATTRRAVGITIAGSVVGAALAFALGRAMQTLLFGLVTTSLLQLIGLALLLGSAALVAAYLPARRATQIDPMNALRES